MIDLKTMKNKKRNLLFFIFFVSYMVQGQDFIKYDQFYIDDYSFNPSVGGADNSISALLSVKKNWIGIAQSPSTQYFHIHTNTFRLGFRNPKDFIAKTKNKIGLGLSAYNDNNGPLNISGARMSYIFHTQIFNDWKISFAASVKLVQSKLNKSMLELYHSADPILNNVDDNFMTPNFDVGFRIRNKKFELGLSVMDIADIQNKKRTSTWQNTKTFFMSSGYKHAINNEITVCPKIVIYGDSKVGLKVNSIVKLHFKDLFWVGAGYASRNSALFYAAINVKYLTFGYSFDYSFSSLYKQSYGNHLAFVALNF